MGFNLNTLRDAVAKHGRVARVVIADVKGSSPREVGAAMLVWQGGQSGTIGGGVLEFELAKRALQVEGTKLSQHALGPEMGQCCGGAVQIVTEVFDASILPESTDGIVARAVDGSTTPPLRVQKILTEASNARQSPDSQLCQGWFIEPEHRAHRKLWIWGAGHVGRALVHTLSPMPDFAITWVDTNTARFPDTISDTVIHIPTHSPAQLVTHAPPDAEHVILTYSHALDLELCHQLLGHDFAFAGLIGSKSKWARFRKRLNTLGHTDAQISRITCPIGDPALGKHPQAIAVGVTASLLRVSNTLAQTQRSFA
ncbi:xanthine dehydrogenase accessory protein XdhC [Planktotalea sp.]|uniref:xanthine dehydrogenase accessory protein XdhC n=1 Tax=Planktotalea sp. TaxID=2029877 RepID=UPI0025EF2AB6|nr:xanthine dehydrogenase accessory protein XdhC [Planktotalea sp.]